MSLTQSIPFTTPSNYTYDSSLVEITGGVGKLKDLRPADATFYAEYNSNINGNWGDGVLTGAATGGAAVAGGKLDLIYSDVRYVDYDAISNADSQQAGCIRFKVTPNYNGAPATDMYFFAITKQTASRINEVSFYHKAAGSINIRIYNSAGALQGESSFIAWAPTAGTEYEFEINYDFTTGANRFFIGGVQQGATSAVTSTRDGNIGLMRIGSSYNATTNSNFKIDELTIFSTVQHTANFTPGSAPSSTIYSMVNPTIEINATFRIEALEGFTETAAKPGSDEIKYVLKKGTIWYFYSGGWIASNETYAQSITAADVETNKATYTTSIIMFGVKLFLYSDDGSTTPEIDLLEIDYDYAGETPDTVNKCIVFGYSKIEDATISDVLISAELNKEVAQYKTNTQVVKKKISDIPDTSDGYWELELIETANMSSTDDKYIFNINGKHYERSVPNEEKKSFWDLI